MLIKKSDQRDILIYAFRNALISDLNNVTDIQNILIEKWDYIGGSDKKLIQREISEMINRYEQKNETTLSGWQKILGLDDSANVDFDADDFLIQDNYQRSALLHAFMYALGRQTYAVHTVQEIIVNNWSNLSAEDKLFIVNTIKEAQNRGSYGLGDQRIDAPGWMRFLDDYKENSGS